MSWFDYPSFLGMRGARLSVKGIKSKFIQARWSGFLRGEFETGHICVLKRCLFQRNPEVGCSGAAPIRASGFDVAAPQKRRASFEYVAANPVKNYRRESPEVNMDPMHALGGGPRAALPRALREV